MESKEQMLQALWAPFLLLHLGGPNTITAYALEDNSLWLRHLLGLLVQVSVAFYIFLLSWGNNPLTFVAIPVFVSGIIKHSERTWALRAASPDHFEDARYPSASNGEPPNLKHIRGDDVDLECVHKGYFLFLWLKRLYANLRQMFGLDETSYSLLTEEGGSQLEMNAFKVVEVQLGFLFDVLYTKAAIVYSPAGLILRLISALSIASALVAFTIVIDNTYLRVDIVITYTLFVGAVSLEFYAFASLVLSDWTLRWLTKRKSCLAHFLYSSISRCRPILHHEKRWSRYMGQLNLVDFCLKEAKSVKTNPFHKIFSILFDKIIFECNLLRRRGQGKVDDELKSLIFTELEQISKSYQEDPSFGVVAALQEILSHRGNNFVKRFGGMISRSFEYEFGLSILVWHVATDLCYYSHDFGYDKVANHDEAAGKKCQASKKMSDYLFYILLGRPSMLPKWIERITHVRDTFNHAIEILRSTSDVENKANACKHVQDPLHERQRMGESLLFEACKVAFQLQDIHKRKKDELWEVICGVCIEMLTYAASHCEWGLHAQQLRNGGEFLTHVCVLMAGLGLSENYKQPIVY